MQNNRAERIWREKLKLLICKFLSLRKVCQILQPNCGEEERSFSLLKYMHTNRMHDGQYEIYVRNWTAFQFLRPRGGEKVSFSLCTSIHMFHAKFRTRFSSVAPFPWRKWSRRPIWESRADYKGGNEPWQMESGYVGRSTMGDVSTFGSPLGKNKTFKSPLLTHPPPPRIDDKADVAHYNKLFDTTNCKHETWHRAANLLGVEAVCLTLNSKHGWYIYLCRVCLVTSFLRISLHLQRGGCRRDVQWTDYYVKCKQCRRRKRSIIYSGGNKILEWVLLRLGVDKWAIK